MKPTITLVSKDSNLDLSAYGKSTLAGQYVSGLANLDIVFNYNIELPDDNDWVYWFKKVFNDFRFNHKTLHIVLRDVSFGELQYVPKDNTIFLSGREPDVTRFDTEEKQVFIKSPANCRVYEWSNGRILPIMIAIGDNNAVLNYLDNNRHLWHTEQVAFRTHCGVKENPEDDLIKVFEVMGLMAGEQQRRLNANDTLIAKSNYVVKGYLSCNKVPTYGDLLENFPLPTDVTKHNVKLNNGREAFARLVNTSYDDKENTFDFDYTLAGDIKTMLDVYFRVNSAVADFMLPNDIVLDFSLELIDEDSKNTTMYLMHGIYWGIRSHLNGAEETVFNLRCDICSDEEVTLGKDAPVAKAFIENVLSYYSGDDIHLTQTTEA